MPGHNKLHTLNTANKNRVLIFLLMQVLPLVYFLSILISPYSFGNRIPSLGKKGLTSFKIPVNHTGPVVNLQYSPFVMNTLN